MDLRKIFTSSVLFPVIYKRETLNAVSLPLAIYSVSWGIGVLLTEGNPQIGWIVYLVQVFAIAVLLANCISLATKSKVPQFSQNLTVYGKTSALLAGYMLAVFIFQYVIVFLTINAFSFETSDDFQLVNSVSQFLASVLLFRFFLVVPHYIYTGTVRFRLVIENTRGLVFKLIVISSFFQLLKLLPHLFFNMFDSSVANLLSVIIWFAIQVVGCFLLSFSYLASLSRAGERDLQH